MITAPSNSHLFFVIEGLPLSSTQQFQCRPLTRLIKRASRMSMRGTAPFCYRPCDCPVACLHSVSNGCQTFRPPKVRFEL